MLKPVKFSKPNRFSSYDYTGHILVKIWFDTYAYFWRKKVAGDFKS
jgi:hypothetical protein